MSVQGMFWIAAGLLVLVALLPAIRLLRRFLTVFFVVFVCGLLLHFRQDPAAGAALFAASGGGVLAARLLRHKLTGGLL